jgi:hypothetical protein
LVVTASIRRSSPTRPGGVGRRRLVLEALGDPLGLGAELVGLETGVTA